MDGGNQVPNLTELDPAAQTDPSLFGYYLIPDESKRNDPAHKNEKILIINVYENRNYSTLADVTEPLRPHARDAVKGRRQSIPRLHVGITGRPAFEADEMRTTDNDTKIAEIIGLSLVFVVLLIFLRNLWLVIVAELCLGVAIGWTFGWASISVGELNVLSIVFVIALIGIGLDYLVQLLTRYRFEKKRYIRPQAIWTRVFRYVSPPISTACLGAAGAFLVANLTDFKGAGELGLIAGGGLLLCLASGYTLLPALLTLLPANVGKVAEEKRNADHKEAARVGWPINGGSSSPSSGSSSPPADSSWLALPQVRSRPDQAAGTGPRIRASSSTNSPTWYAAVMTDDLDKLRTARAALTPAANSTIIRTDSILDAIDKQEWLAHNNNADPRTIQWSDLLRPKPTTGQIEDIARAAQGVIDAWSRKGARRDLTDRHQIDPLVATLKDKTNTVAKVDRIAAWQRKFIDELHGNARPIRSAGPLDLARTSPRNARPLRQLPRARRPAQQRIASQVSQQTHLRPLRLPQGRPLVRRQTPRLRHRTRSPHQTARRPQPHRHRHR